MCLKIQRYPVDIRGICDDAYCPHCNYEFRDDEVDCNMCPICSTYLDWEKWHYFNDDDVKWIKEGEK